MLIFIQSEKHNLSNIFEAICVLFSNDIAPCVRLFWRLLTDINRPAVSRIIVLI